MLDIPLQRDWLKKIRFLIDIQKPVSLPNESQTSLYVDKAVKPENIILRAIETIVVIAPPHAASFIGAGA